MSENEIVTGNKCPQPKKTNRGVLLFAVAMALGLFALIALNMH